MMDRAKHPDWGEMMGCALAFRDEVIRLRAERAAQAREIATLRARERGAVRLAGVICDLIDRGALSARSEAGDALIDYASDIYGDARPIECVREAYAAPAARAPEATP